MRISDWSSDVCSSDLGTRREQGHDHMSAIRTILLAEDSPNDAEMAIDALRDAHLVNPIVHVEDGVEALDYLLRRGRFADRPEGDPAVLLLDIKMPRMDGLEVLTQRSEEHTSELQSLMRISYAVFCLKKKKNRTYRRIQSTLQ